MFVFEFIGRLLSSIFTPRSTPTTHTEVAVDGLNIHVTIIDHRDSDGPLVLLLNDEYGHTLEREEIKDLRKERYKINMLIRQSVATRHAHIQSGWLVFKVEQQLSLEPLVNPCVDG